MSNSRTLQSLGLAQRAGLVRSGEAETLEMIRKGKAKLVFLAEDASYRTKKRFIDKTGFYRVPVIDGFDSSALSKAVGKNNRKVIAVIDADFARLITASYNE